MIVADIVGPWHNIEAVDPESGATYQDERRVPQFLHDVTDSIPWQDVTAQDAADIIPDPALCVWRVWGDAALLAAFDAHDRYVILRQGDVDAAFQAPGW